MNLFHERQDSEQLLTNLIMELKVLCDCGQKYVFDVEPVAGQMPIFVNCPSCGKDGTQTANILIAEAKPPSPLTHHSAGPVRLSAAPPMAQPLHSVQAHRPSPPVLPAEIKPPARTWEKADMTVVHSLALGVLGAVLGAVLGVILMFGFLWIVGISFPLMGLAIGALTGFGARLFYKGTDMTLGVIAGVIALVATGGTFLVLFGIFAIMNLISLVVSASIAYKISS